jgi:hypothetical protein
MSNRWVVVGLVMAAGFAVVHCNSTDALPPIDTEGAVVKAGGGGSPNDDASSTSDAGYEADQAADAAATVDAADAADADATTDAAAD